MKKVLIFGNSGSGKSTLAKHLADQYQLKHLDLDTLAWQASSSNENPPQRKPIEESQTLIQQFLTESKQWVIEGCYSDLLALLVDDANEMIFMDLPLEATIENAKKRPWEPHKYQSKASQDANLPTLIDWIKQYQTRQDDFSRKAHQRLFDTYQGKKSRITQNPSIKPSINQSC